MGRAKSMEKQMILQRSRYGTALGAFEKYCKALKNNGFAKDQIKDKGVA